MLSGDVMERRNPLLMYYRPRPGADLLHGLRLYPAEQIASGAAETDFRAILAREYPGASDVRTGTPEETAEAWTRAKPPTARP